MEQESKDKILEGFQHIKNLCSKANKESTETSFSGLADMIIAEATRIKEISVSVKSSKDHAAAIPDLSSFRILLVEDNQVNIMVAEAFLKKTGVSVEIATNGLEAVEKIKSSESSGKFYHIVFMDMQMPVMNGPDAIKTIRNMNSDYAKKLKIIAMTGTVLDSEITSIRKSDINGYITKPVSANVLYSVCSDILSEIRTITPIKNQEKPVVKEPPKIEDEKNKEESSTSTLYPDFSSKKILVVDDNKLNVEILNLMLKKTNAFIEDAFDGEEALQKFLDSEEFYYDMILMDIQMPKMDGNQCAFKIRQSGRKDSKLPIIAISANAFQEDKDKSLSSGINFHMSKPVNMKALHEKMKELFE